MLLQFDAEAYPLRSSDQSSFERSANAFEGKVNRAELYETKRRQLKLLISNNSRDGQEPAGE
jgi:hypothetical protein